MRTLLEREWIKIVGQREAPGRPAIYGTTKAFLDYFGVRSLDQLPPLDEIRELVEPVLDPEAPAAAQPSNNRPSAEDQDDPASEQNEVVLEKTGETETSARSADMEATAERHNADPSIDNSDGAETTE